jgi:hypothetical protein
LKSLSTIFQLYHGGFVYFFCNHHYLKQYVNALGQVSCFYPSILVSSINKSDHHDIAEILLKVVLNTITQTAIISAISWRFGLLMFETPLTKI